MSPPYCPETNILESGSRFSCIGFWAGFTVQTLIYETRVPDSSILVSGRCFLPPFYFFLGEAPGRVSEACLELFWAPKLPETSIRGAFEVPSELVFHIGLSEKVLKKDSFLRFLSPIELPRSTSEPGVARFCPALRCRRVGSKL